MTTPGSQLCMGQIQVMYTRIQGVEPKEANPPKLVFVMT